MGCANSQELTYLATVPQGAFPGQTISVPLNGTMVLVYVPQGATQGQLFRFKASEVIGNAPVQQQQPQMQQLQQYHQPAMNNMPLPPLQANQFRVTVPQGIYPGQQFDVSTPDGQRLRLVCPPNVYAGQTFIGQLPPPAPTQGTVTPTESPSKYASDSSLPTKGADGTVMVAGFSASSPPAEVEAQPYDSSLVNGGSAPIEVAALPMAAGIGAAAAVAATASAPSSPGPAPAPAQQFKVVVPAGVQPGQSFEVNAGGKRMMVTCPPGAVAGSTMTIAAPGGSSGPSSAPASPTSGPPAGQMDITVPEGVEPGQTFEVVSNGTRIGVKCPPNTRPGQKIRIQIPANKSSIPNAPPQSPSGAPQMYQVQVPPGVAPGANFEVQVGGKRAMVQCPSGVQPGQTIQISV